MAEGQSITPSTNVIMRVATAQNSQSISPFSDQNNLNNQYAYLNSLVANNRAVQNNMESSKLNLLSQYNDQLKSMDIGSKMNDPEYQRLAAEAKLKQDQWNATHGPVMGGSFEYLSTGIKKYEDDINSAKLQAQDALRIMNNTSDPSIYAANEEKYQNAKNQYQNLSKLSPSEIQSQYKDEIKTGSNKGSTYASGWGEGGRLTTPGGLSQIATDQQALRAQQNQDVLSSMITRLTSQGQRLTPDQINDYTESIRNSGGLTTPVPQGLLNQLSATPTIKNLEYTPLFSDTATKEQIETGLANAKTNRQMDYWLNQKSKLYEENIHKAGEYSDWAGSVGGKLNIPMQMNPWDISADVSVKSQQINRGIIPTQTPTPQNYLSALGSNISEFNRQVGEHGRGVYGQFANGANKADWIEQAYKGSTFIDPLSVLPNVPVKDESQWLRQYATTEKIDNPLTYNPVFGQLPSTEKGVISGDLNVLSNVRAPFKSLSQNVITTPENDFIGSVLGGIRGAIVATPQGGKYFGTPEEKAKAAVVEEKLNRWLDFAAPAFLAGGLSGKAPKAGQLVVSGTEQAMSASKAAQTEDILRGIDAIAQKMKNVQSGKNVNIQNVDSLRFTKQSEGSYMPGVEGITNTEKMRFRPDEKSYGLPITDAVQDTSKLGFRKTEITGGLGKAQSVEELTQAQREAQAIGAKSKNTWGVIPVVGVGAAGSQKSMLDQMNEKVGSLFGFRANAAENQNIPTTTETPQISAPLQSLDEMIKTRTDQFEKDVEAYKLAGSSDEATYNRLKQEEGIIKNLQVAQIGEETTLFNLRNNNFGQTEQPASQPKNLGPMEINKQIISGVRSFARGDIMGGYEGLNKATAAIFSPIGKATPEQVSTAAQFLNPIATLTRPIFLGQEKANEIKSTEKNVLFGAYKYAAERPLDVYAMYLGGQSIGGVEAGASRIAAGTAEANIPLISRAAQAGLSSPISHDLYALATKVGLPALYGYTQGSHILGGKTQAEKEERLGETGVQIGSFSLGMMGAPSYPGSNTKYYPKEYTPLEKGWNKLITEISIIGKSPSEKTAIRGIFQPAYETRFIRPANVNKEIDLTELTKVRTEENAAAITAAAKAQPSSMYGSGTIRVGASELPTGKRLVDLALPSKDYDGFAQDPDAFRLFVANKIGGSVGKDIQGNPVVYSRTGKPVGIDIHPMPGGYPNIGQSTSEGVSSYLFGKPQLKVNPYEPELTRPGITPKYEGELTYEQLNVQGSKSFNDLLDNLQNPMERGYRIPKSAVRAKLIAEDLMAVAEERGLTAAEQKRFDSAKKTLDNVYKQEITYKDENGVIRTETINSAAERYIQSKQPVFSGGYTAKPTQSGLGKLSNYISPVSGAGSLSSSAIRGGASGISRAVSQMTSPSAGTKPSAGASISIKGGSGMSRYLAGISPSKPSKPSTSTPRTPSVPSFTSPSLSGFSFIPPSITPTPSIPTPPSGGSGGSSGGSPSGGYGSFSYSPSQYYYYGSPSGGSGSKFSFSRNAFGAPFLAPGAGGAGGGGRGGGFDKLIQNPLDKLRAGSELTGIRTKMVFSGLVNSPNRNLTQYNKPRSVQPVQQVIRMPQLAKQYKPQKQNRPAQNIVDMKMFTTKKKRKGGLAF